MSFNKEKAQLIAVLRQRSRGAAADSFEFTLVTALGEAAQGRPEMATTILRSDVPLTKDDREWFAKYIARARAIKEEMKQAGRKYRIEPEAIQQAISEAKDHGIKFTYKRTARPSQRSSRHTTMQTRPAS